MSPYGHTLTHPPHPLCVLWPTFPSFPLSLHHLYLCVHALIGQDYSCCHSDCVLSCDRWVVSHDGACPVCFVELQSEQKEKIVLRTRLVCSLWKGQGGKIEFQGFIRFSTLLNVCICAHFACWIARTLLALQHSFVRECKNIVHTKAVTSISC